MEFLKIPAALNTASPKDVRLYCAYMDFKAFNSEGVVSKTFLRDKYYYAYWKKRLIDRGWIRQDGKKQTLISYQAVWRDLGVLPSWSSKQGRAKLYYKKIQIEDLPLERKAYFKALQEIILKRIADSKVRQIKWRLRTKPASISKTETFISCRTIARLFGLRSPASGHKYRKTFFSVINEPAVMLKTDFGYRFKCKQIAL